MRRLLIVAAVLGAWLMMAAPRGTSAPVHGVRIDRPTALERGLRAVRPVAALGAVRYAKLDQVTVDNTAGGVGFTATKYQPNGQGNDPTATYSNCRLETAEIRFTTDGSTVTTTVGVLLEIGDWLTVNGTDLIQKWRGIRTGASSGVADCNHYQP